MVFQYWNPSKLKATDLNLSTVQSCDSLDQMIESIFVKDATFSKETTEIADQLVLVIQNKNCQSLPDALNLLGIIQYNLNEQ